MIGKKIVVVAPHPDDETLGCGGTLLSLKDKGYSINWLIITEMNEEFNFSAEDISVREKEIFDVSKKYGFDCVLKLGIPTSRVDQISKNELVNKISIAFNEIEPNTIFIPFINDVHTDHKLIAEACISSAKWFRHPYIESVMFYETLSETDNNIDSTTSKFNPNVYFNISEHLKKKIDIMKIFNSEISDFPFPRSVKAVESLAYLRGSQSGYQAAEAFELLKAKIN